MTIFPLVCTNCGEPIEANTKYMVLYRIEGASAVVAGGYILYEACEHTDRKLRLLMAMNPPAAIAGSAMCLADIITANPDWCAEHRKEAIN